MITYDVFTNNPILLILLILVIFGLLALGVFLARKYIPAFKSQEKPKSDREIAEEEVKRVTQELEEEEQKQEEEEEERKKGKPTEEEALAEELARLTQEVEDPEAKKEMEEYAASHPDEGKGE